MSSSLGGKVQRIKSWIPTDSLIGMIWADNTTINQLFRLIIIDSVSQFITNIGTTTNEVVRMFLGFRKGFDMIKVQDAFPKQKLKEGGPDS